MTKLTRLIIVFFPFIFMGWGSSPHEQEMVITPVHSAPSTNTTVIQIFQDSPTPAKECCSEKSLKILAPIATGIGALIAIAGSGYKLYMGSTDEWLNLSSHLFWLTSASLATYNASRMVGPKK